MKPLLIVLSLTLTLFVTGQTRDTISSQLMQLKKPKHIVEKYVNFDVVKVFTLNHGRATIGGSQGFALSYSAQLLWPYSAFKHSVPIAFGVRFGASKFSLHHKELDFQNDDLVSIVENKSFKRTMQRTGHAGVIAMLVKQWKMQGITFMGGISAEYNMFSRLKVRSEPEIVQWIAGSISTVFHIRYIYKSADRSDNFFPGECLEPMIWNPDSKEMHIIILDR